MALEVSVVYAWTCDRCGEAVAMTRPKALDRDSHLEPPGWRIAHEPYGDMPNVLCRRCHDSFNDWLVNVK